jgi:FkbM family methyltransferase
LDGSSICIDLGANVGVISEQLADSGAHVHAFEPDPWAFEQLRNRLAGRTNVTTHNAAIGVRDGTITLMRDPSFGSNPAATSQGTSAFHSNMWQVGQPEQFEVECVDIRRFLRSLGRDVDLVKIDIEGAEVELLEALLDAPEKSLIHTMFVETHEAQMPELRPRLRAIRQRAKAITRPVIHLNWH